MDNLTDKQMRFVMNKIAGMGNTDAYRDAYNCENMKNSTITRKANELMKVGIVSAMYEKLSAEREKMSLWNAQRAEEELLYFLELCKADKDKKHGLGYIKELNALNRLYESKDGNKSIKIEIVGADEDEQD